MRIRHLPNERGAIFRVLLQTRQMHARLFAHMEQGCELEHGSVFILTGVMLTLRASSAVHIPRAISMQAQEATRKSSSPEPESARSRDRRGSSQLRSPLPAEARRSGRRSQRWVALLMDSLSCKFTTTSAGHGILIV